MHTKTLFVPHDASTRSAEGVARVLSQCFCESRWAMLIKDFDFALDLAKLTETEENLGAIVQVCTKGGGRRPPMMCRAILWKSSRPRASPTGRRTVRWWAISTG
eukprot:4860194-Prymnesium_polylepis.1